MQPQQSSTICFSYFTPGNPMCITAHCDRWSRTEYKCMHIESGTTI